MTARDGESQPWPWKAWREGSVDRRVASAMVVVGVLTAVVKLTSIAKEAVVAARLGTGPAVDAFALAYRLPAWGEMVVPLAFAVALVPAWIRVREKRGEPAAARLLGQAVSVLLLGLLGMTLLLAVAGQFLLPLMGRAFDAERLRLARLALMLLLPFLVPIGLYHCWGAVLNAKERFAVAAVAPVLTPLCVVAALLLLPASQGTTALATGTVAGAMLQAATMAAVLIGKGHGLRPRRPILADADLRDVLDRFGPLLVAHAILGLSPAVDHAMAATLGAGSNAALEFGLRVPGALASLGMAAVGSAVLPYFSVMAAREDWVALRRSLRRWVIVLLAATLPIVLSVAALATPITRLLFQRGAFGAADTALVAPVMAAGVLQVAPFVVNILLGRVLLAMGGHRTMLVLTAVLVATNALGNWALMHRLGVAGIALSTAGVYSLACVLTWWAIRRRAR